MLASRRGRSFWRFSACVPAGEAAEKAVAGQARAWSSSVSAPASDVGLDDPEAGRQRRRCRRRDGVRPGGHLSRGRQHRRRRLHGRPSRRQGRAGRHRLSRDRPGRRHQDHVRQGRQPATATGSSACRARCAAWRWRTRSSASCRGRTSSLPAVAAGRGGLRPRRASLAGVAQRHRRAVATSFAELQRVFGKDGGKATGRPATAWCSRTWRRRCG